MATPTMITIRGVVQTPPGDGDATFQIKLEQMGWLTHSDGTLIEPTSYLGVADADGSVEFQVPGSTDPSWLYTDLANSKSGTTWAYRVTMDPIDNLPPRGPFYSVVDSAAPGGVVTLGSLIPAGSPLGISMYAPLNHHHTPDQVGFAILGPTDDPTGLPDGTVIIRKAA